MPNADDPAYTVIDIAGIREYLAQTAVIFAILFGSHAKGTADESSDVDIALRFPEEMSDSERFHQRNRLDAELQSYARGFVDVSDIDSLPTHVAHAALQNGVVLTGDEQLVAEYQEHILAEYNATVSDREKEYREFIDRLARGDV